MALRIDNAANQNYELNSEIERLKRFLNSVGLKQITGIQIKQDMPFYTREALLKIKLMEDIQLHSHDVLACLKDCQLESDFSGLVTGFSNNTLTATERQSLLKALDFLHAKNKLPAFSSQEYEGLKQCVIEQANHELATQKLFKKQAEIGSLLSPKELGYREKQYLVDEKNKNIQRVIQAFHQQGYLSESMSVEEISQRLLDYVRKNFTYKAENHPDTSTDHWQSIDETYVKKTGDCEDLAIVQASLLMAALKDVKGFSEQQSKNMVVLEAGYLKEKSSKKGHMLVSVNAGKGMFYIDPSMKDSISTENKNFETLFRFNDIKFEKLKNIDQDFKTASGSDDYNGAYKLGALSRYQQNGHVNLFANKRISANESMDQTIYEALFNSALDVEELVYGQDWNSIFAMPKQLSTGENDQYMYLYDEVDENLYKEFIAYLANQSGVSIGDELNIQDVQNSYQQMQELMQALELANETANQARLDYQSTQASILDLFRTQSGVSITEGVNTVVLTYTDAAGTEFSETLNVLNLASLSYRNETNDMTEELKNINSNTINQAYTNWQNQLGNFLNSLPHGTGRDELSDSLTGLLGQLASQGSAFHTNKITAESTQDQVLTAARNQPGVDESIFQNQSDRIEWYQTIEGGEFNTSKIGELFFLQKYNISADTLKNDLKNLNILDKSFKVGSKNNINLYLESALSRYQNIGNDHQFRKDFDLFKQQIKDYLMKRAKKHYILIGEDFKNFLANSARSENIQHEMGKYHFFTVESTKFMEDLIEKESFDAAALNPFSDRISGENSPTEYIQLLKFDGAVSKKATGDADYLYENKLDRFLTDLKNKVSRMDAILEIIAQYVTPLEAAVNQVEASVSGDPNKQNKSNSSYFQKIKQNVMQTHQTIINKISEMQSHVIEAVNSNNSNMKELADMQIEQYGKIVDESDDLIATLKNMIFAGVTDSIQSTIGVIDVKRAIFKLNLNKIVLENQKHNTSIIEQYFGNILNRLKLEQDELWVGSENNVNGYRFKKRGQNLEKSQEVSVLNPNQDISQTNIASLGVIGNINQANFTSIKHSNLAHFLPFMQRARTAIDGISGKFNVIQEFQKLDNFLNIIGHADSSPFKRAHDDISYFPGQKEEDEAFVDFSTKGDYEFVDQASTLIHAQMTNEKYVNSTRDNSDVFFVAGAQSNIETIYNPNIDDIEANANQSLDLGLLSFILDYIPGLGPAPNNPDKVKSPFLDYNQYVHLNYLEQINQYQRSLSNMLILVDTLHKSHLNAAEGIANAAGSQNVNSLSSDMLSRVTKDRIDQEFSTAKQTLNRLNSQFNDFVSHINSFIEARHEKYIQEKRDFYSRTKTVAMAVVSGLLWGLKSLLFPGVETAAWEFVSGAIGLVENSEQYYLERQNYRYKNPHIMQHYSLMNNNANMFEYNLKRPMDQLDQVNYQLSPTFNRHSPSWYSGFSNQDYQEAYRGSSQQNRPSYVDNYWINRQSLHNGQLGFQSEDFHRRPSVATSINSMMYNTKTGQGINDRYQEQTGRYLLQTMLKFDDQRFRLRQLTGGLNWTRKIYGSGVDKDVANPFLKTMLPRLKYQPGTQKVFEDGDASTLINDTGDGGFAINHFALSQVQQIRYSVQEAMTFKFDLWEQYLKTMSAVVATMLKLFSRTAQVQTTDAETISSVMDNAKNLFDTIMDFESTFHNTLDQELNVLVESLNYNMQINKTISEQFFEVQKSIEFTDLGLVAALATFPWSVTGFFPFIPPPFWTPFVLSAHYTAKEFKNAEFVELKNDTVGFSPRNTGYADSLTLKGFLDSLETDMSQINEDFGFGVASPSHDQQAIFLRENDERASIDATNSQFILPQLATQRRSGGNTAQARLGFYNIFQRGNQQDPIEELTNSLNAQTYQAFQALSWADTSNDPYFLAGNDAPSVQEFNLDIRSRISQNEFENIQTRGGSFSTQSMVNNTNLRTISASTTPGLSAYDLKTTNANKQVDTTVDSVKREIEPTTAFGQALDFIGGPAESFDARQLDFAKLAKFEDLFSEISIARLKLFNMIKLYLETLTNVTEQVIDKAFGDLGVRRVEMARPIQNIMGYIEKYNGMQNTIKDQIIKELEQQIRKYNEYLDAQQELWIDRIVNYSMAIVSAVQLLSRRSAVADEEKIENVVNRQTKNTARKGLLRAGIKLAVELIKLNELYAQKRLETSEQVKIINEEIDKALDMTDEDQNEEPTPVAGATQRSQDGNTLFGTTSSKGSRLNIGVNVSKLPKADSSQDKAMLQERSGLPGLRTKFVDQSGFAKAKIKEKQRQKRENMIMEILSVAMNQLTAASDVAGQGGVTGDSMEVLKKGMAVVQARRSKKLELAQKKAETEKNIQNTIVQNIRDGLIGKGTKLAEKLKIYAEKAAKKIHKNSKRVRKRVASVRNRMTKMSRSGKKQLGKLNNLSKASSIKQNAKKANIKSKLKAGAGASLFLLKWSFKSAAAVTKKAFEGSKAKSLLIFRALNNDDSKEIPSVPAGNDDALLQDDENLDSVNDAGIETAGLENFVLNQQLAKANRDVFKEIVNNDVMPFLKWDSGNILKNALDAFQAQLKKTRESKLKKGIKLSKGKTGLMGVLQNIIGGLRVGIEFSLAFFNILTSGGRSDEEMEALYDAAKSQFGNPEKVRQEKIKKLKKIDEKYKKAERRIMGMGNDKVKPEQTPGADAVVPPLPPGDGAGAAANQDGNAAVPPGPPASANTATRNELMDFINDRDGSAFKFQNVGKDGPSGKFDEKMLDAIAKGVGIDLDNTQLMELKNQMDSKEADLINIERDKTRKLKTFGFGFTFNLFNPFNRNKLKKLSKKVEKIFEDINLDGKDTDKLKEALKKHIVPESPNELGHNAAVKLVAEFNKQDSNKQATVKQMKQLVSSENGKKISLISNRFIGTSKTTALARIKVARNENLQKMQALEKQTVPGNLIQSAGKLGERGLFNKEKSNSLLELNQALKSEVATDEAKKKFLLETPLDQISNQQLRDTAERMRKVKDTEGEEEVESFVKALKPDGKLNQAIQKEVATDKDKIEVLLNTSLEKIKNKQLRDTVERIREGKKAEVGSFVEALKPGDELNQALVSAGEKNNEEKIAFLLNRPLHQIENKQLRDTVTRERQGQKKEVDSFVNELNAAERISEIQKKLENGKQINPAELAGLSSTGVFNARLTSLETQSRKTFNNISVAERQLMKLFRATFQKEQSSADTFDNDKKNNRFKGSAGTSLNLLDQRNKSMGFLNNSSADSDEEDVLPLPPSLTAETEASQLARDFIGFSWEKMDLFRKPHLSRTKHQEEKLEGIKSQFKMLDQTTQQKIKEGAKQLKADGNLKATTSDFLEQINLIERKVGPQNRLNDAIFLENPFKKNDAAVPGVPENAAAAGAFVVPPLPPDNGAAAAANQDGGDATAGADVVPPLPPDNGADAAANQGGGDAADQGGDNVDQMPTAPPVPPPLPTSLTQRGPNSQATGGITKGDLVKKVAERQQRQEQRRAAVNQVSTNIKQAIEKGASRLNESDMGRLTWMQGFLGDDDKSLEDKYTKLLEKNYEETSWLDDWKDGVDTKIAAQIVQQVTGEARVEKARAKFMQAITEKVKDDLQGEMANPKNTSEDIDSTEKPGNSADLKANQTQAVAALEGTEKAKQEQQQIEKSEAFRKLEALIDEIEQLKVKDGKEHEALIKLTEESIPLAMNLEDQRNDKKNEELSPAQIVEKNKVIDKTMDEIRIMIEEKKDKEDTRKKNDDEIKLKEEQLEQESKKPLTEPIDYALVKKLARERAKLKSKNRDLERDVQEDIKQVKYLINTVAKSQIQAITMKLPSITKVRSVSQTGAPSPSANSADRGKESPVNPAVKPNQAPAAVKQANENPSVRQANDVEAVAGLDSVPPTVKAGHGRSAQGTHVMGSVQNPTGDAAYSSISGKTVLRDSYEENNQNVSMIQDIDSSEEESLLPQDTHDPHKKNSNNAHSDTKDQVIINNDPNQQKLSDQDIQLIFDLLMLDSSQDIANLQHKVGMHFFNQLLSLINEKVSSQNIQQLKRVTHFELSQNLIQQITQAFHSAILDQNITLLKYLEPLTAVVHYQSAPETLRRYALYVLPQTKKIDLCKHLGARQVLDVIKKSHCQYQQKRIFNALTQLYPLIKEQENLQVMFQPHTKEMFYFLNNKQAQKNHYDLWEMACIYASDYYDHCYTRLSTERLQLSVHKSLQNCREEFNDKFKKLLANSYQNNSDLVQAINQPKQCFEMFLANMPAQLKAIHNQYVKHWGEGSEKLIEKIITTYQHKQVLFNIGKLSLKTLKQQTHLIEFVASLQHVPNSLVYCYKQDPAIFIKACIALDQLKYSKDITELLNQLPLAIINEITRVKENASRIMDCVFSNNADVWATYLLNNHNHQHNYTLLKSLWCLNKSGFEDAFLKISAKGNAALLLNIRNKNQKIITQKQSSQLFQMLKQYGYVTQKGYASTLISKGVLYQHEQLQKIANLYGINPKVLSERLHILQNKLDMWVHYLNKIKQDAQNDEDFRTCLDHVLQNLSGHRARHCQAIESLLKEAVKNLQSINKKELCLEILDLLRPYEAQITSNLGMQDIFKDHPLLWDNTGQLLKKLSQTSLMGAGGALELESAWRYFQQLNAIQWVSKQKNKEIITQIDAQHMKALLQYDSGQFSHPLSVVYNRLNNQDQACLFDCLDQYSDSQRSLILSRLSICNNQMGINYEKAKPLMLSDTELLLSQIENSKHRSYDVLSLLNTYYQQQKSKLSLMKMALGLNATQINVYRNEWDMLSTLHKQDENCLRAFLLLLEPGLRQSYLSYLSTHSSKYKDLHEALQEDIKQSYMGTSMQKGPVAVASILFLLRFSSQPDKANILISAMKQLNNQDAILFLSLINELDSQKHAFEKLLFSHQSLISFMSSKIIKLSKKIDARSIKHFLNDSQIKQSIQSAIISNPLLEEQFLQNNQNPDVDNDLQKHHPDIKNNHEVQKDAQKKIKQLVKLSFNTLSNKKGVSFDDISKFYDSLKETDFALAFCTHFQDYSRKFPVKASYCVYHLLRHSQEKQRHLLNSLRAKINVISVNHLQSLDTCINTLLNTPEVKSQKLYTSLKYLYAQDNVLYNNYNL